MRRGAETLRVCQRLVLAVPSLVILPAACGFFAPTDAELLGGSALGGAPDEPNAGTGMDGGSGNVVVPAGGAGAAQGGADGGSSGHAAAALGGAGAGSLGGSGGSGGESPSEGGNAGSAGESGCGADPGLNEGGATGCYEENKSATNAVTGEVWITRWQCQNQKDAILFTEPNADAPMAKLVDGENWFVCYRQGECHGGGNDIWYYTQGDVDMDGQPQRNLWGYVPAVLLRTDRDPFPGMPACSVD